MCKKVFAVIIILAIVCCMVFECSLNASAVVIADDALVIASVFLSLAGAGLTVYSWSEYFQSDNWRYFCNDVAHDISTGFSMIVRNGKRYVALARLQWGAICDWISSKFAGKSGNVDVPYEVPTHPDHITLRDGSTVPWAAFMENPFVVYKVPTNGRIYAFYCTGQNVGVNLQNRIYRVWCTGHGQTIGYECVNGAWTDGNPHNMNYGLTYKGVTGSFFDVNLPSGTANTVSAATQYRTMDSVLDSGTPQEETPPNTVPTTGGTAIMQGVVDENKLPDAVDGPTAELAQGEQMIIEVPQEFLDTVETEQGTVTQLTTNIEKLVVAVNGLRTADVRPLVMTNAGASGATVEQIIDDTVESELESVSPDESVQTDTEIADKFRLPKSFLEGFPFSIPYSIYLGLQSFVAEPEAPCFVLPFSIPRLGIDETVRLDLAQFNPLARVCRAFLSLVWVAGLAMACHTWIKR